LGDGGRGDRRRNHAHATNKESAQHLEYSEICDPSGFTFVRPSPRNGPADETIRDRLMKMILRAK
jgi:hypothetical protein